MTRRPPRAAEGVAGTGSAGAADRTQAAPMSRETARRATTSLGSLNPIPRSRPRERAAFSSGGCPSPGFELYQAAAGATSGGEIRRPRVISMPAFAARRLMAAVPLIWGVLTLVFLLAALAPGRPFEAGGEEAPHPRAVDLLRSIYRTDRPLLGRYASWLSAFTTGDFGLSFTDP